MRKRRYAQLEEHVLKTFRRDRNFTYRNKTYEVLIAGKPHPQGYGGECKTDVFVRVRERESGKAANIKISVKTQGSQEFQENKITAQKAEAYFGCGWERIIYQSTIQLKQKFENRPLLYASDSYPTKGNSVTVGWKLEIASKPRELSVRVPLSDQEIRDYVYRGTNQPFDKINAVVNGTVIEGSGVADYLLATDMYKINTAGDVIDQMVPIKSAVVGDTYLIFTANNYRMDADSADGPRALAVRIEWKCVNRKLVPHFCYDEPLRYTGHNDMRPLVLEAFRKLGKANVREINPKVDLETERIFRP